MTWLALDIGGANIKLSDGAETNVIAPFPLWARANELPEALEHILHTAPTADGLAITMTGELADCFATKAEGVTAIIAAAQGAWTRVSPGGQFAVYRIDGALISATEAAGDPIAVASANWHALARFATRYATASPAVLIDIGSTTTDIIPLVDGASDGTNLGGSEPELSSEIRVAAAGRTDPERLASGELVYTGVKRTPLMGILRTARWRGCECPVALEHFAIARDAYLVLGDLQESPNDRETADGRAATRAAALDRMAKMVCADRTMFDMDNAVEMARRVRQLQAEQIAAAISKVIERLPEAPRCWITAGEGEFLAHRVLSSEKHGGGIVSLTARLGSSASRVAPAFALARLACENTNIPSPQQVRS